VPAGALSQPPPWDSRGEKLCELLEGWRSTEEARRFGFTRLRSRRPPPAHLGTAQRRVLRGHEDTVTSVALNADGTTIVGSSWNNKVRVWDAASGEERRVLPGHPGWAGGSVALSADGRTIVIGTNGDGIVRVWDAASGEERRVLRGHEDTVRSVALSGDGTTIVSGSADGTVRVWDAASGRCREVIEGKGDVEAIAAGPSLFPLRALGRRLETVIEDAFTAAPVAWFPVAIDHILTFPGGRSWVGAGAKHLYIISLEGRPSREESA
jgi:WD40 repeat protein